MERLGKHKKEYPLVVACTLLALLSIPALAGCGRVLSRLPVGEEFVSVVIENHTSQELEITISEAYAYQLEPCTVQVDTAVPLPPTDTPLMVTIQDPSGNLTERTVSKKQVDGSAREVQIRIPVNGSGTCPPQAEGFRLLVKNVSGDDITLWYNNAELGAVPGRGTSRTKTFGPLQGSWRDAEDIVIHHEKDERLRVTLDSRLEYRLGSVPDVAMLVEVARSY